MTKQEIFKFAESKSDELVKLASDLIKIPNENPTGTQRKAVDFVENYLKTAGIEFEEVCINKEFPCIISKIGEENGFSIILNGHIDVVPAGDLKQWKFNPFSGEITKDKILGRGASDMKAGVAGILFAMKILKETNVKMNGNIRLHIVSDEESGGQFGSKWLCDNGYSENANACLVAEPTTNCTIEIGQKGGVHLILKSYGKSAHGSLGGFKGDNAIVKLSKVLENIHLLTTIKGNFKESQARALANSKMIAEDKVKGAGVGEVIDHVTANVGLINGGTRPNMVPDYCEAIVDIRLPIGVIHEEIENMVKKIIDISNVEGVEYELEWKTDGNYTEEAEPIVQSVKNNAEKLWNIDVIPAYQWASSDARYYRLKGIPTIQYGPSNSDGIHSYNEDVDIQDVVNAGLVYIMALCDMLGIK